MPAQKRRKQGGSLKGFIILTLIVAGSICLYQQQTHIQQPSQTEQPEKRTEKATGNIKAQSPEVSVKKNFSSASAEKKPIAQSSEALEIPVTLSRRDEQILKRTGYTVSYNAYYKTPNWVGWELTRKETKGKNVRINRFSPDPDLPEPRVEHADYTHSGYDRGHMAPAGDMKWSLKAMRESFYLSNICPQKPGLNRGVWKDLEEQVRLWAKENGRVWIACGPVISSDMRRLGKNRVGIPKSFYKVLCMEVNGKMEGIGFLFENRDYENGVSPRKMAVTIDSVENLTGIDFFPALPDAVEGEMEATINWSRWSF